MQFVGFHIKNFKGIEDTFIDLRLSGANVFTLIGLNESGKTTILEAINHHSDNATDALFGEKVDKKSAEELAKLVPKSEQSDFSKTVSIVAHISFEEGEKKSILDRVENLTGFVIDPDSVPNILKLNKSYIFKDSDFIKASSTYNFRPKYRTKRAKKFTEVDDRLEPWTTFSALLRDAKPDIAFFPTFLFNQPERIYLAPHEDETDANALYRTILENIAADLPKPLDIQRHLVDRLLSDETVVGGIFNSLGLSKSKSQQITAAKNDISNHLTRAVFQSWTKTFGGDFGGREIILQLDVETEEFDQPLVYARFEIKDDGGQYEIRERSLGFRWFFSFVLFTLFGSNRIKRQKKLFLLDEPASNLHSRAQMQLLESFRRISEDGNQIIYSTHSHYLINPEWLDQAFIVSNAAIDYDTAYQNDNVEAKTSISSEKYKSFVGRNPDKVTYFQPVLDKLDVAPSKLDLTRPSVVVEGKGDYRVIEALRRQLCKDFTSYSVVPTRGATGMDELIGLFLGWSVPFVICLDDDSEGRAACVKYRKEWSLPESGVFTLGDVHPSLKGKVIEGILSDAEKAAIREHFGVTKLTKGQIGLYFSEALASGHKIEASEETAERVRAFDARVRAGLSL